jgi:hypothetical protein
LNPQDDLFEIIDNYLNDALSEKERISFEEKIAHDEALASKVSEVRAANEAIYYGSLAELKATIGQEIKNIKYKQPFNWKKISFISIASLALLSGVTTYLITDDTIDETRKSDSTSVIEIPQPKTTLEKNTSTVSEKIKAANNSTQLITSNKQQNSDTSLVNSTSTNETILPSTNQLNNSTDSKNISIENKNPKNGVDSNTKKIENPILKETKISCDKTFNILTDPSCKQQETGSISITSDGNQNYLFQVANRSNSGSKAFFQQLSAGEYEILVTYGKECSFKKKVNVEEKWCAMNTSFSFNPDYNEKWIINYETGASGRVIIYDRSGKEVYSSIFGGGNEFWDGSSIHGGIAPVGIYLAIIRYSDGRQEKVELTIVR